MIGALARHVDITIVDVAIRVQHWNEIDFAGVDKIGDPLLRVVFIDTKVARATCRTIAVGVLERGVQSKAIAVVIKSAVTVCIAPWIFVHFAITIVVVTDVVVGKGDDFHLHKCNSVGHPLTCVVVAHNHHIVAVRVVTGVTNEGVVVSILDIAGDFQPW